MGRSGCGWTLCDDDEVEADDNDVEPWKFDEEAAEVAVVAAPAAKPQTSKVRASKGGTTLTGRSEETTMMADQRHGDVPSTTVVQELCDRTTTRRRTRMMRSNIYDDGVGGRTHGQHTSIAEEEVVSARHGTSSDSNKPGAERPPHDSHSNNGGEADYAHQTSRQGDRQTDRTTDNDPMIIGANDDVLDDDDSDDDEQQSRRSSTFGNHVIDVTVIIAPLGLPTFSSPPGVRHSKLPKQEDERQRLVLPLPTFRGHFVAVRPSPSKHLIYFSTS
ncbi:unnamed protein product [Soboliphyme baturini]|uniref:Uncharacterized protein n=1 Tax=Soboliphyme baturini TaxID=241478 RepID=A0A183IFX7_9BILA|nr:unnamed protein product [Soboliphyme baturini]